MEWEGVHVGRGGARKEICGEVWSSRLGFPDEWVGGWVSGSVGAFPGRVRLRKACA